MRRSAKLACAFAAVLSIHAGQASAKSPSDYAFAAAEVLAESRPDGEWSWRTAAYSLGALTAYARLDGNMHWLSDTVAGAALGVATGHFVSSRETAREAPHAAHFSVQPLTRGALVSLSVDPYALLER